MEKYRVSVYGASGYTGGELVRLIAQHPNLELAYATSRKHAGKYLHEVHPQLYGVLKKKFTEADEKKLCEDSDLIFTATPHGTSMTVVPQLIEQGAKVVDLSGDYRFKDKKTYEKAYNAQHQSPELLPKAVYGLPELYRQQIKKTSLVANPGCYPTSAILALWPLEKQIEKAVVDSKSGVSGAGAEPKASTHFPLVDGNIQAYKVTTHRHGPEIQQHVSCKTFFTPHLVPITRGIETTIHAFLKKPINPEKQYAAYTDEPFIRIRDELPSILGVVGSNYCDIGYEEEKQRLVIVSVIDNLVKGASGQAIQNANLMLGLQETAGLSQIPAYP